MGRITAVSWMAAAGVGIWLVPTSPALAAPWQAQAFARFSEQPVCKAVYDWELWGEDPIPYYDADNYCWQQVWTPQGWRWVDVCHGYAF